MQIEFLRIEQPKPKRLFSLEARAPLKDAKAAVEIVRATGLPCMFKIYWKDSTTAWLTGRVPSAVLLALLQNATPLAPRRKKRKCKAPRKTRADR